MQKSLEFSIVKMMSNNDLSIVIRAVNEAKATLDQVKGQLKSVGDATSQVNAKAKTLETSFQKVKESMSNLRQVAIGVASIFAGIKLGKGLMSASMELEQQTVAFETMLGSAKKAQDMLAKLSDFAERTPFELQGIRQNAKMLMAMGIENEKLLPTLKSLGDVSAGLSVPLERLALNFGQVKAQGKLTGRELRDFAIAGVPLTAKLAEQLHKTTSEISDMVSKGSIGFTEVEKAFTNMAGKGGKFFNLMDKQSHTLTGKLSNLHDSFTLLLEDIGKNLLPILKKLTDYLRIIVEWVGKLSPAMKKAIAYTGLLASSVLVLGGAYKILAIILPFVKDLLVAVKVAMLQMNPVMIGITVALGALYLAWKFNWFNMRDVVKKSWESIKNITNTALDSLRIITQGNSEQIGEMAKELFLGLAKIIKVSLKYSLRIWIAFYKDILANLVVLIKKAIPLFGAFVKYIGEVLKNIDWSAVLKQMYSSLVYGLTTIANVMTAGMFSLGKNLMKSLWSGVKGEGFHFELLFPSIDKIFGKNNFAENIKKAGSEMIEEVDGILSSEDFGFRYTTGAITGLANEISVITSDMADSIHKIAIQTKILKSEKDDLWSKLGDLKKGIGSEKALKHIQDLIKTATTKQGYDNIANLLAEIEKAQSKLEELGAEKTKKITESLIQETEEQKDKINKQKKELESLEKNYSSLEISAVNSLTKLKQAHDSKITSITNKIKDLKAQLKDLRRTYDESIGNLGGGIGTAVVEQQQKIADLRKSIKEGQGGTDNLKQINELKARLYKEERALAGFKDRMSEYQSEISEAKRRANLTDFQRTIEDLDKKKELLTKEFDEKQAKIKEDLEAQRNALGKENSMYEQKRATYNRTLQSFKDMAGGIIDGQNLLVVKTETAIEKMRKKYEELKSIMSSINSISSSPSWIGGTPTPIQNNTNSQQTINNQRQSNTFIVNVKGGENDKKTGDTIVERLTRLMERKNLASS